VAEDIIIKKEDKNNITINLSILLDKRFNLDKEKESNFNNTINSNEDIANKNI
jgi:hypothetical protein